MRVMRDIAAAFQFLTRIPVAALRLEAESLSRAVAWFPLVGLAVGKGAWLTEWLLAPHLGRSLAAVFVLAYLVLVTGGLHEDGLADVADAFGGGWNREQILSILKDSRVGTYGAIALILSFLARYLLISGLPTERFAGFMVSAQIVSRWTAIPLGHFSKPATGGQGSRVARRVGWRSLVIGSAFTLAVVGYLLRSRCLPVFTVAALVVAMSGLYYERRIGGVTGDCFGATIQLTEIAVYLCGVWRI